MTRRRKPDTIFQHVGGNGHGPGDFEATIQPEPTHAQPGSRAKLAVLIARAANGEALHHEADVDVKHVYVPK